MFEDEFTDRLQKLMDYCRSLSPAGRIEEFFLSIENWKNKFVLFSETDKPVLVAGDPERDHMALCDRLGGIPYPDAQIDFIHSLARSLKIDVPKIN